MRLLLTIIFIFSLCKGIAQNQLSIGLQYNFQYLSDYVALYSSYELQKHEFKLGFRYQLQHQLPQEGVLFYRGGYGDRLSERLGGEFSYHFQLWNFKDRFKWKLGYVGTYIHTGYRLVLAPNDIEYFEPIDVLSHHLTTKASYRLRDAGKLWIRLGAGLTTYFNVYKGFANPPRSNVFGQERDVSIIFTIGGEYPIWQHKK